MNETTGKTRNGRHLGTLDATLIVIGIVVGAGIFRTPPLVAEHLQGRLWILVAWVIGGVISLAGALCYAELASAYPDRGGEYTYLKKSFGDRTAFAYLWSRMLVVQTGSIAMMGFLAGDYLVFLLPVGDTATPWLAGLMVVLVTYLNIRGIRPGVYFQRTLLIVVNIGLLAIAVSAFFALRDGSVVTGGGSATTGIPPLSAWGRAMIFVLLTFGGWNEAAYLSGDVQNPGRNMLRVLLYSMAYITCLYVLVNYVFIAVLGPGGVAGSDAVAATLMDFLFGGVGGMVTSVLIVLIVLSTMNGVIITGARSLYAFGRDYTSYGSLGEWNDTAGAPVPALLVQGVIALVLVGVGSISRDGFVAMVDYTAPVFWLFFLLVGVAVIVLRYRDRERERPYRVPLFPVLPVVFCLSCLFMLYSSVTYAGTGSLLAIAVLLSAVPAWPVFRSVRRGRDG